MNNPICECGHKIGYHQDGGYCIGGNEIGEEICPCDVFKDARIAALEAKLTRRDAAYQALVEYAEQEDRSWAAACEDSIGYDTFKEERREALKLVAELEDIV